MPDFPSLAAVRQGLTTDNADRRGEAYGAVLSADVQPSDVLGTDPDDEVVEELVAAGVVPEGELGGGGNRQSSAETRQRQVELLEAILAELQGDATTQGGDAQ